MNRIESIPGAISAILEFHQNLPASTPDELKAEIATALTQFSPVDQIMHVVEALYANLDKLTKAGKELLAELASMATTFGWHNLGDQGGRGLGIIKAARREAGEEPPSGAWPKKSDDPKVHDRFQKGRPAQPIGDSSGPAPDLAPSAEEAAAAAKARGNGK